jgi:mannose-6-phosphate isomerase-like protein (cupin superfamily)
MALSNDVRRVVTTVDAGGKAVVLFDGANPHKNVRPGHSTVSRPLWVTDQSPVDLTGSADRATQSKGIMPPRNGSVFRIVEFPPDAGETKGLDNDYLHKQIGSDAPKKGRPPRHPLMHRTRTIDYAIILQGEIDMLLDDSEVHFKAGDVLVQQGTNHAWVNKSGKPCRICFVLIDSKNPPAWKKDWKPKK